MDLIKDSLSIRMKDYEKNQIDKNVIFNKEQESIVIIIDGKNFKKISEQFVKPFDPTFHKFFEYIALHISEDIPELKLTYIYGDQIVFFINSNIWMKGDRDSVNSKLCSMATYYFNDIRSKDENLFSGAGFFHLKSYFKIPNIEIVNYLIYSQNKSLKNYQYPGSVIFRKPSVVLSNDVMKFKKTLTLFKASIFQKNKDFVQMIFDGNFN